jgi:hypothetical protein
MPNMPRKILLIAPQYPPCNLAAVHRSRLFARHLPDFGWEPVILTVKEQYYEEKPDPNLARLLPEGQRIEKVDAFPVTRPRLVGDIGLRSFFQMRKRALELVRSEKFDFVYIPIPPFYTSLIGPYLNSHTGVRYGIDYIDPWVHVFPGSDKTFSRHWWSTRVARILEPIAVGKASLITGVAEGYYKGVQERHPKLTEKCVFGAMPYGGEASDHASVKAFALRPYLFRKGEKKIFVYAGAMLPNAYEPLEAIFSAISSDRELFSDVEFHFIGTGKIANDPGSYNIRPHAERHGLWGSVVFEYPQRIPYLDVLVHLEAADAVFILGSTDRHYTPSKTYQGVLSRKPILAVLHAESTAVDILRSAHAGIVIDFPEGKCAETLTHGFSGAFRTFREFSADFDPDRVDLDSFNRFSARAVTAQLADFLDEAMKR